MFKAILHRFITTKKTLFMCLVGILIGIGPVLSNNFYIFHPVNYYLGYPISAFSVNFLLIPSIFLIIYRTLFPLIVTISFADIYAEDVSTGYGRTLLSKVSLKKYLRSYLFASFVSGGIIAILPLITNFIALLLTVPLVSLNPYYSMPVLNEQSFLVTLYFSHPFIYFGVKFILIFFFAGLLSSLATAFSFLYPNKYLTIILPMFLISFLDMVIQIFAPSDDTLLRQFIGVQSMNCFPLIFATLTIIFIGFCYFIRSKHYEMEK